MKNILLTAAMLLSALFAKATCCPSEAYFVNNTPCTVFVVFHATVMYSSTTVVSQVMAVPPGSTNFASFAKAGFTTIIWSGMPPGSNVDFTSVEYSEVDPASCTPGLASPMNPGCSFIGNVLDGANPMNCIESSGSACSSCPDNFIVNGSIVWGGPWNRIDVTFN